MEINNGNLTKAQIDEGFRKMVDLLAVGGRIVIGADEVLGEGLTIGKVGERHLCVKRRATRQEFLDTAPAATAEERAVIEAMHPPFYYELELWDRVLEGADGVDLGIRIIREHRKAGG